MDYIIVDQMIQVITDEYLTRMLDLTIWNFKLTCCYMYVVNSVFELPLSSRILLIAGYVCKHTGSKHFDSRSIAGSTRGRIKRSRKMINTDDTTAIEYGYEAHNYSFSLERLFYIVRIVAETVESSSNSAKESSDINVFSQLIESASLLSQVAINVPRILFSSY